MLKRGLLRTGDGTRTFLWTVRCISCAAVGGKSVFLAFAPNNIHHRLRLGRNQM
jgi:hypothetical protein